MCDKVNDSSFIRPLGLIQSSLSNGTQRSVPKEGDFQTDILLVRFIPPGVTQNSWTFILGIKNQNVTYTTVANS